MKRTKVFAGLVCALLAAAQLGCGAFKGSTNKYDSVTLSVALINGAVPSSGQGGIVTLPGLGGTIQLQAMANYSDGKSANVTSTATYTVILDPESNQDQNNVTLLPPCATPNCPVGTAPNYTAGTVSYSASGLLTAVEPAVCTWVNGDPSGTQPAWAYVGDYVVTATYEGITSQPIYVPVASAAGVVSTSNPTGACGPS